MEKLKSVFETLNAINVNEHTEKKNNLTYLSWAWAETKVKQLYPNADVIILKDVINNDAPYFHSGNGAEIRTIGYTSLEERDKLLNMSEFQLQLLAHSLPIMDFRNQQILYENITSTDVNKSIQRAITKEYAHLGLGLYIYAGEDLPDEEVRQATSAKIRDFDLLYSEEEREQIFQHYQVNSEFKLDKDVIAKYIEDRKDKLKEAKKQLKERTEAICNEEPKEFY